MRDSNNRRGGFDKSKFNNKSIRPNDRRGVHRSDRERYRKGDETDASSVSSISSEEMAYLEEELDPEVFAQVKAMKDGVQFNTGGDGRDVIPPGQEQDEFVDVDEEIKQDNMKLMNATRELYRMSRRLARDGTDVEGEVPTLDDEDSVEQVYRRIELLKTAGELMERDAMNMELVARYGASQHGHPILDPRVKREIYETHKEDPEHWTVAALSSRYQLGQDRVRAILRCQRIREEDVAAGRHLDTRVEEEMGAYFGFIDRMPDKTILAEAVHRTPRFAVVDEDANQPVLTELRRRAHREPKLRRAQYFIHEELPATPPPSAPDEAKVYDVKQYDVPNVESRRLTAQRPRMVVERCDRTTGVHVGNATRTIMVEEKDGVRRTATWSERRKVSRLLFLHRLPKTLAIERRMFPGDKSFLSDPSYTDPDLENIAKRGVTVPDFSIPTLDHFVQKPLPEDDDKELDDLISKNFTSPH